MVVAQLAERSPPTPEIHDYILQSTLLKFEKTKLKEKRVREWPIFNCRFMTRRIAANHCCSNVSSGFLRDDLTFPILIYCHEIFLIKNVCETLEYDSPVTISTSAGNYKQSMIIIYDSARVIMTKVCIECDYGVANYAFTCLIRLCF